MQWMWFQGNFKGWSHLTPSTDTWRKNYPCRECEYNKPTNDHLTTEINTSRNARNVITRLVQRVNSLNTNKKYMKKWSFNEGTTFQCWECDHQANWMNHFTQHHQAIHGGKIVHVSLALCKRVLTKLSKPVHSLYRCSAVCTPLYNNRLPAWHQFLQPIT